MKTNMCTASWGKSHW